MLPHKQKAISIYCRSILLVLAIMLNSIAISFASGIDSLKLIAEGKSHDSIRIKAYFAWDDLIYFSDPELDFELNNKICELAKKGIKGKPDKKSVLFFKIALAKSQNNLGMIYFDRGDYKKAIELHSESLKINDELKDDKGSALTLGNLANIYYQLDELDKALEYYGKNLSLAGKLKNSGMQATTLNNIANIYADKKKFDLALQYYRESYSMSLLAGDSLSLGRALNNIGTTYNDLKNYDSAFFYYEQSLFVRRQINDLKGLASSNGDLGLIFLKKRNYERAIFHLDAAEKFAREASDIMDLMNISRTLYEYHSHFSNHKEALRYYVQFVELKDSIASEENTRASIQREYKYNYEKQSEQERIRSEEQKKVDAAKLEESKAKIAEQETRAYALYGGLFLVVVFLGFVINRYKVVQNQKNIIEIKEKETQIQKELIEEKQREILDSITYAKRIQDAILPSETAWFSVFPESFVLYQPKDIIAGDFYWMESFTNRVSPEAATLTQATVSEGGENKLIFAAVADCTGHGVPGAMVSVVCSTALTKCIQEYKLTDPGKILDKTRELVVKQFEKSSENVRDGMDISLFSIIQSKKNENGMKLSWAGANNPLIHVRNGEMTELVPDKEPIGMYENPTPFKSHELFLEKGDMIYLFSDGYADQFGGQNKKKFRKNNLYKLLNEISAEKCKRQKEILLQTHHDWKGTIEQIDDVCIIGIRI